MHLRPILRFAFRALASSVAVASAWAATSTEGGAGAASSRAASSGAPTWTNYFYPLTVGWTCHESIDSPGVTGSETLRVASVTRVPNGRTVTVDEGSATTVNGTTVPTNAALHYILTSDGKLVSEPSAEQLAGQSVRITGNTIYPSVRALVRGSTSQSYVRLSETLPPSALSQSQGVLTPGSTGLDAIVGVRQSGSIVATFRIPMGTFHQVLVVDSHLESIKITNAVKAAAGALDAQLQPYVAKSFNNTVWYARGVGPIKVAIGTVSGVMTSCGPGTS